MAEEVKTPATAPAAGPSSPRLTLSRFLATLRGTDEEVYGKLIQLRAKTVMMEADAWRRLLEDLKAEAAHPLHPNWKGR